MKLCVKRSSAEHYFYQFVPLVSFVERNSPIRWRRALSYSISFWIRIRLSKVEGTCRQWWECVPLPCVRRLARRPKKVLHILLAAIRLRSRSKAAFSKLAAQRWDGALVPAVWLSGGQDLEPTAPPRETHVPADNKQALSFLLKDEVIWPKVVSAIVGTDGVTFQCLRISLQLATTAQSAAGAI